MPYRNLFIIRTALMTGVFLFAGVAYFGPRFGVGVDTQFPGAVEQFRYVLWGFVAIAVAAALLLRSKLETATAAKQAQFLIIGWAIGEAASLFGTVQFMSGAGIGPLGLGLMTFVFTLVMLPIPRPRR